MIRAMKLIVCVAVLVITPGQSSAGLIAWETTGGVTNGFTGVLGNRFNLATSLTIDGLGVYDYLADG